MSLSIATKAEDAKGPLAGSSVGYARIDTDVRSSTLSGVSGSASGSLSLTRPDLQAGRIAALRAAENAPLEARRADAQRRLNLLRMNEPPTCDNCMYNSAPLAADGMPGVLTTTSAKVAAAGAGLAKLGDAAVETALEAEVGKLDGRIAAVNAKAYGDAASLAGNAVSLVHQPLLQTFDRSKTTQELRDGVAVTAAFGKAAYKTAGDEADKRWRAADSACSNKQLCPEADKWGEGGAYRAALHMAIGAMSQGAQGAMGNLAGSVALNAMTATLDKLGIADPTAGNLLKSLASTIAGAAAGGAQGAAAAFNADANNRQLHINQTDAVKQRAKALAGVGGKSGYQWEVELTRQLLRQSDAVYGGFTESAESRAILASLQNATGISMSAEGTSQFTNSATNSNQIQATASSYLAAGNLPPSSTREAGFRPQIGPAPYSNQQLSSRIHEIFVVARFTL